LQFFFFSDCLKALTFFWFCFVLLFVLLLLYVVVALVGLQMVNRVVLAGVVCIFVVKAVCGVAWNWDSSANSVCVFRVCVFFVCRTGEIKIQIDNNIRGSDVFVIQPTCAPNINDHVVELLLLLQTLQLSSAKRITAVVPYYGYARQDRKTKARVPISAAAIATMIETMGAHRVLVVDLHCGQIQVCSQPNARLSTRCAPINH
jgi:hypothetical protein